MKAISPPALMLFCVLAMIGLHLMIPLGLISSWVLLVFGIAFIAFGLVMAFGAEGQFRRRRTTVNHTGTASKLVSDGWFKYSRNPMYLSFVLMLIGAGLSLRSLSPLLCIIIFMLLTEHWYILPEEKRLAGTFGKEYKSYQSRTRRWL